MLYLSKQELSFRGHDESSVSLNKGKNYRELLELIAKFDPQFERRLHGRLEDSQRGAEGGGTFTGVSSDIQNDIIESIDLVIQDEIDKGDMVLFLNFLCLNSNFCLSIENSDFHKATSQELLDYINNLNLQTCFFEVFKLLLLNTTIVISSSSVERSFSCLKRIKTSLKNRMEQDRLGCLCQISVHKDILKELENKSLLHSLILDKFIEKPRRLNFVFK